jgi:hypothetical protein
MSTVSRGRMMVAVTAAAICWAVEAGRKSAMCGRRLEGMCLPKNWVPAMTPGLTSVAWMGVWASSSCRMRV